MTPTFPVVRQALREFLFSRAGSAFAGASPCRRNRLFSPLLTLAGGFGSPAIFRGRS